MNGSQQTQFANLKQIPAGTLKPGQTWYMVVTPFDGTGTGTTVQSNSVTVTI
jgi:hypothetical protein